MSKRRELERSEGPRRRVRFTYLAEAWPEGARMDPTEAVLKAPPEAVIAALTKDVEVYGEVIQHERARANKLENRLLELERAGRVIGELLGLNMRDAAADIADAVGRLEGELEKGIPVSLWQGGEVSIDAERAGDVEIPTLDDVLGDKGPGYRSRNDPPADPIGDVLRP